MKALTIAETQAFLAFKNSTTLEQALMILEDHRRKQEKEKEDGIPDSKESERS